MEFLVFQSMCLTSCRFTGYICGSIFLHSLTKYLFTEITLSCLCSKLNSCSSLRCFCHVTYFSSLLIFIALHWTCLSVLYWRVQHQTQQSSCVPPALSQEKASLRSICWQCQALLAYVQFFIYQDSECPGPSLQSCFLASKMWHVLVLGAILHPPPQCRTSWFPLLNVVRFLWAHFSCLLMSFFVHFLALLRLKHIQKNKRVRHSISLLSSSVPCLIL